MGPVDRCIFGGGDYLTRVSGWRRIGRLARSSRPNESTMNVSPSTLEQLPLRNLVEFAALCAKRVRPTFDRWARAAKYRPAIDSAITMQVGFSATS
jgi:hypothetical protein